MKTPEELENFMLKHGENIIDTLGAEVDRLEKELKVEAHKLSVPHIPRTHRDPSQSHFLIHIHSLLFFSHTHSVPPALPI